VAEFERGGTGTTAEIEELKRFLSQLTTRKKANQRARPHL
jgi:hypothetical protein